MSSTRQSRYHSTTPWVRQATIREAAVVAQDGCITKADKAVNQRAFGSGAIGVPATRTELAKDVAITPPPGNVLGFESPAEKIAVLRVGPYRLADDDPDLQRSFVFFLRKTDDVTSHSFFGGGNALMLSVVCVIARDTVAMSAMDRIAFADSIDIRPCFFWRRQRKAVIFGPRPGRWQSPSAKAYTARASSHLQAAMLSTRK